MPPKNPPATRTARLRLLVETAEREGGPTFDVPYLGERKAFRRITVDTSLPLFRLQNGRTHRKQTEYLERHPDLPSDFFHDPEDPQAQAAQEEILLALIDDKDLAADLNEREQHTPLVLTADGIVLDGNRRLAALRKAGKSHASAVVLPATAEAKDLYETEIELQMQRDTKAEYGWVDRTLHIDYGIRILGESIDVIAKRMRLDRNEVKAEQQMLDLAKLYLVWLGHPGQYHRIPHPLGGDSEQSFRELAQRLNSPSIKKMTEEQRRIIREGCFLVIREERGYQAVRDAIKQLSQNAGRVKERLDQRELPLVGSSRPHVASAPTAQPPSVRESQALNADPLLALAGESDGGATHPLLELAPHLSDEKRGKQVLAVIEELTNEEKETKKLPLQRLQRALTELRAIELSPVTGDMDAVARALSEVAAETDRLAKAIEFLRKSH